MSYSRAQQAFLRRMGRRIRYLREQKGWSQEEFASKSGLHRTYVGSIERGERNVSMLNVKLLASILDIHLSGLFAEND